MIGPKNVLILSATLLLFCIFSFIGFALLNLLPWAYGFVAGILPVITGAIIMTNLEAYKIPAGMKMINIMGLSVMSAVFCAAIPAIYLFSHLDTAPLAM